jgi:hypothetical protein
MAQLVTVDPTNPLREALDLLEEFIVKLPDKNSVLTLTDEESGWFAGSQERLFVSADHESEGGSCDCQHHEVCYRFGSISESGSYADVEISREFLEETIHMIRELLE